MKNIFPAFASGWCLCDVCNDVILNNISSGTLVVFGLGLANLGVAIFYRGWN